jgi:hypothetical protein
MSDPWTLQGGSGSRSTTSTREEWEDWEDDEVSTPITTGGESPLLDLEADGNPLEDGDTGPVEPTEQPGQPQSKRTSTSAARQSLQRIRRLRSRHRQKAQNARVGIKLVTDMSILRKQQQQKQQQQHIVHQMRPLAENRHTRTGKFVDAAALKALEGSPSDESIGTFAWLKPKPTKGKRVDKAAVETSQQDLSPNERPIVIGFAMPSDSDVVISPQTAVVETPVELARYFAPTIAASPQLKSAWSPDTEDGISPPGLSSAGIAERAQFPDVASVQKSYTDADVSPLSAGDHEPGFSSLRFKPNRRDTTTTSIYVSDDNDDMETPVTLFEEDGSPATTRRKSFQTGGRQRAATGGSSRSQGWWDQVTSPFAPATPATPQTPASRKPKLNDNQLKLGKEMNKAHSPAPPASGARTVKDPSPMEQDFAADQAWSGRLDRERSFSHAAAGTEAGSSNPSSFKGVEFDQSRKWWDEDQENPSSPIAFKNKADHSNVSGFRGSKAEQIQEQWKDVVKKGRSSPIVAGPEREPASRRLGTPESQQRPPIIVVEDLSPSTSPARPSPTPEIAIRSEKSRSFVEEEQTPAELPPPYSPPKHRDVRYRAVFPPGHPLRAMYPPSPGPVSPGLSDAMRSQGGIGLTDVPLTPPPLSHQIPLPDRPLGSFEPGDQFSDVVGHGPRQKAERQRRRHEKEDAIAWRAGRLWSGRGCFSLQGCFGRPGREGRKRRRAWLGVCVTMALLTILGVVLGVILSRRAVVETAMPSQWLNLTNFPPIPTGISTVIGPDSNAVTACVQPPTLWSCALPKEQASSVAPFDTSQPSFVFQIQFDNNTRQTWNITARETPRPTLTNLGTAQPATDLAPPATIPSGRTLSTDGQQQGSSLGVPSDPPPPSFQEMFFLGNTSDGVVSDDKAGEPTPFYISVLRTVNDTVGPNVLLRRDDGPAGNFSVAAGDFDPEAVLPPPALEQDGTSADAVPLGFPKQQPLRLYDRGLPTERYGFYTYYSRTLYVKSVEPLELGNETSPVPADLNGGCLKTEAKFVMTWTSVRYKVEIWTRRYNTTRLVGGFGGSASPSNSTQPGTMPYPITVTLDTHGGEFGKKWAFHRGIDDRQRIIGGTATLVLNNMNTTGDWINPGGDFNPSFGGMDGGTGGCKCEYTNFVGVNGQT